MASSKTNKALILKLKQVRDENKYSINEIVEMVENNGDYVSRASVQRVFADGSEEVPFRYEDTIKPIANALLGVDTIEEEDDSQIQSMKVLLQYKDELIHELNSKIEQMDFEKSKEILEIHEKMDKERESWGRSIDFLKQQIEYKDSRIDKLLHAVEVKDEHFESLFKQVLSCPCRQAHDQIIKEHE